MAASDSSAFPTRFVIVTFTAAILIGAVIAFYGINGHLGWGIP